MFKSLQKCIVQYTGAVQEIDATLLHLTLILHIVSTYRVKRKSKLLIYI